MTQEESPGNVQPPSVDSKENVPRNCAYTMHGVLHYLQHEWSKYDMEKARWEMERAELQARISFLQGERKGQENLKADLIRRIKMLEYCLKQERAKNYRLTHNGEDPPVYDEPEADEGQENLIPTEVDAYATEGTGVAGWKQGRQLLKQYLQEIGYSETILDVRSFRVKNLLGLIPEGEWPSNDRDGRREGKHDDDSDNEMDEKSKNLDSETADVLDSFDRILEKTESDCGWGNASQGAMDRLKEEYKEEQRKRHGHYDSQEEAMMRANEKSGTKPRKGGRITVNPFSQKFPGPPDREEFIDIDGALGLPPREIDIKTLDEEDDDPSFRQARWSTKATLRSHLDSVRAMQFHPVEPVLFTASDDGTIKMWNLDPPKKDDKHGAADGIEPIYTFRGHLGPVVCMDLSISGDTLYSGGFDGVVCCWTVPSSTIDQHAVYDPKVLYEKIRGHKDVIWSVAYHSSDNRLVSAGADNLIKVWEPGNFSEPLIKTIESPEGVGCPVSVDFVSTEPSQLLVAYKNFHACLVHVETGYVIRSFDFGTEDPACHLTRILSHPTMPITVIAASDRKIRYFDNTSGQMTASTVAHMDAVSSLSIDPNGLYLLSGSHDGSLRLWNLEKKVCLQEISAHRKKYDAAVMSVAFHPSRPIIGSTGADGLVKVFTSSSE